MHQRRGDDFAVARGLLNGDHALGAATVAGGSTIGVRLP
jgi:hypothetical protein